MTKSVRKKHPLWSLWLKIWKKLAKSFIGWGVLIFIVILLAAIIWASYNSWGLWHAFKVSPENQFTWWADRLPQLVGGLLLLGGIYVAYIRSEAMQQTAATGIKSEQATRYVESVKQLGAVKQTGDKKGEPNIELRIGGLFGLEKLMKEAPGEYHHEILSLLCSYLRNHIQKAPEDPKAEHTVTALREDVHTCLQIVARREKQDGEEQIMLRQLDFSGCQLGAAKFAGASLVGTFFTGARLRGADFTDAQLQGADFTGARLQGADFKKALLEKAILTNTHLEGADFTGAWLNEANFTDAWLEGADFTDMDLWRVNFTGAKLKGAKITGARLVIADFTGAELVKVDFTDREMIEVDFRRARLEEADFTGAYLGPYLVRDSSDVTDFSDARHLTKSQLLSAKHIGRIILPNGDEIRSKKQLKDNYQEDLSRNPGYTPPPPKKKHEAP